MGDVRWQERSSRKETWQIIVHSFYYLTALANSYRRSFIAFLFSSLSLSLQQQQHFFITFSIKKAHQEWWWREATATAAEEWWKQKKLIQFLLILNNFIILIPFWRFLWFLVSLYPASVLLPVQSGWISNNLGCKKLSAPPLRMRGMSAFIYKLNITGKLMEREKSITHTHAYVRTQ